MRIESVLRNLRAQAVAEWPKHLGLGWKILSCELAVDDEKARAVLLASLSAAHSCAQAINRRSRANVYASGRKKLHAMFARVARCIHRSPAALRRSVNANFRLGVGHTIINSESIETLIDGLVAGFERFSLGPIFLYGVSQACSAGFGERLKFVGASQRARVTRNTCPS
jgi:hypothetical protein